MNHRDLIKMAKRMRKFAFLELPDALQDEIMEGLDNRALDLRGAADLIRARGYSLSFVAVANYCAAVRNERSLYETRQELTRVMEEYQGENIEQNAGVLANFLIATAIRQLADGSLGIKDVDLGKVLMAMSKGGAGSAKAAPANGQPGEPQAMSAEAKRTKIKETIEAVYGISVPD